MESLTERLPTEIILLICEHLAADSSTSLLHLCLTSKRLHDLAYPIIYHDVRLKSHYGPHSALLRFSQSTSPHLKTMQSIDIRFTRGHMSAFLTGIPSAFSNLQPTAALLPKLTHLRTFILQLEHHEKRNAKLPDSAISLLLRSLPKSLRNLEIDTEGSDKVTWEEQRRVPAECFCADISAILPQLQHLRLRKGYLCSRAFNSVGTAVEQDIGQPVKEPWPLRTLTVRLDLEKKWAESPLHSSYCHQREAATSPASLTRPLHAAVEAGILPDLQQAVIISMFGNRPNLCTARRTKHSGFAIYDPVRNCTTLIPVLAVEVDLKVNASRNYDATSKQDDLFLLRDLDGLDRFTSYSKLERALERSESFRQVISSDRLFPYKFDISQFDLREQTNLPKDVRMSIWQRESKVGQILLSAKEIQGVEAAPNGLDELLPRGWVYGVDNKKGERQIVRSDV